MYTLNIYVDIYTTCMLNVYANVYTLYTLNIYTGKEISMRTEHSFFTRSHMNIHKQ